MARPQSNTVEYFSHDTDALEKKTLTIMLGEFDLAGVGFWWSLLEWLGKTEGHYYNGQQSQDLEFLLRKLGLSFQVGTEMLDKLAFLGGIDPVLWSHRVIWSQNFVDRLALVYKKRERPLPQKPCFCDGNCNHSALLATIPVTETPLISPETPHSIVDNSIVDNSIVNKSTEKRVHSDVVFLTDEENEALIKEFGALGTKEKIEALALYIKSKGDKYESHYYTILNWERMNGGKSREDKSKLGQKGTHLKQDKLAPESLFKGEE